MWEDVSRMNFEKCVCGKAHRMPDIRVRIGPGVVEELPLLVKEYGARRPFLLSDVRTFAAAGEQVCELLRQNDVEFSAYSFQEEMVEPDEKAVGRAMLYYDARCDMIIGIGSGVINDIGKIMSAVSGNPYIIVATAPSMDGYASASSSMIRENLKISLSTRSADVIIGDTRILKKAPVHMCRAGLGDMLAKYISIAEWRISHVITGEYYCERIAELVRASLRRCVEHAKGLLAGDEAAVEAVFEGLVVCGAAMALAGVTRPASGIEHYFSHIWDIRGVEFGTPTKLHGIQCAVATRCCAQLYEKVKKIVPDREKAVACAEAFDLDAWNEELRKFLGRSAETMIELEKKEHKYDAAKQKERCDVILKNWEQILRIIEEEIPSSAELAKMLDSVECPREPEEIGIDHKTLAMTFRASRDIRDKYILSRMAWDLGITDTLI